RSRRAPEGRCRVRRAEDSLQLDWRDAGRLGRAGALPRAHRGIGSMGAPLRLPPGRRQDEEPLLRHARRARSTLVRRDQVRAAQDRQSRIEGLPWEASDVRRSARAYKQADGDLRLILVKFGTCISIWDLDFGFGICQRLGNKSMPNTGWG